MTMGLPIEQCRNLALRVCQSHGVDLEDLVIKQAGRREVVTVVVDQDGGVDLDSIARVSSALSNDLDESGFTDDHPYVLEVTSPGVDRPLTEIRHWRRAISRLVEVAFIDEDVSQSIRITGVQGGEISGELESGESVVFSMSRVHRALVQVEFNREE